MFNEELSGFAQLVLPALALPIIITAWIIHTISNKVVDCFYDGGEDGKK